MRRCKLLCLVSMFFLFLFVAVAFSADVKTTKMVVGKSRVIVTGSITRVSVGNPDIADVVVISPKQVLVNAKAPGVTNVTLWRSDDNYYDSFDLHVSADITQLKQKLKEVLPDEDIKVHAAADSIILSGEVSSTVNLSIAIEMARPFAPKEKLVNLLQVGGVQQVMLEVRVAEMGRKLMKRLGFNFSFFDGKEFAVSLLNNLTGFSEEEGMYTSTTGATINGLFRFYHGSQSWTGFIDALKGEGVTKILAEPTLITLSGQEAEFHVGGQFAVPEATKDGEVTINWKDYGVTLQFTPRVLSNDKISMKVFPCVSELDWANSISSYGFVIPALTTRYASTTIELDDGQSFAIAGLLKEEVYEDIQKFPILGDIPILGALFRSSVFKRHETELIIIVTPHLVKPLDMDRQTLPTDAYVEPDDFEFYVMGFIEGIVKEEKRPSGLPREEGLEGKFGHIAP